MACIKNHVESDFIVKELPISQGSFERHKCASCAYERGLKNGKRKILNFDLEHFITNLPESQKRDRRHKSAIEAYTLGFFHGLNGENNHLAIKNKHKIAIQMRDFGLKTIAAGINNSIYPEQKGTYSHALGLTQVANGFEILIKSKIVDEHPLLVFDRIPKETKIVDGNLKFEDLLEHGQTITYGELPERLWATTGYKIKPIELYNKFGSARNQIIHFAIPNIQIDDLTLEYTFKIIEKALNDWWDITILEYVYDADKKTLPNIFNFAKKIKVKLNYSLDSKSNLIKLD